MWEDREGDHEKLWNIVDFNSCSKGLGEEGSDND